MKSTCVSTSHRILPAMPSLLPKPGFEPGVQQLEPPLECGAIAFAVQLGRDEREDEVRELIVELRRLGSREACGAKARFERLRKRMRVGPCERPAEERNRPGVGEEQAPRRAGDSGELVPPV